jgi:hypothetical protein
MNEQITIRPQSTISLATSPGADRDQAEQARQTVAFFQAWRVGHVAGSRDGCDVRASLSRRR